MTGPSPTDERKSREFGRRWRRGLGLAWPVTVDQAFSTLMRTTDLLVSGMFSPATILAVGLADQYASLPRRLGFGLGSGVIALTSQEAGGGSAATRDDAVSQSLLLGALLGLPFVAVGFAFGEALIALLGASPAVSRLGGLYLAIVFAISPMRLVGLAAERSLNGVGDTRTPMYANVTGNAVNIALTVGLGLGVGPLPRLGIVGIAAGTAVARVYVAAVLVGVIAGPWSPLRLIRPRNWVLSKQIVTIGLPSTASGFVTLGATFLFNVVLLLFGTNVAAAYYVGRRVYQQVGEPFARGFRSATSIMVGQSIGQRNRAGAYFDGVAMSALGLGVLGVVCLVLFAFAPTLVTAFTDEAGTIAYATAFLRVFAVAGVFLILVRTFSSALTGGSETRVPFVANLTGMAAFTLGVSYLFGVILGYGVAAVYAGLVLTQVWGALVNGAVFYRRRWLDRAIRMMDARQDARPAG